MVPDTAEPSPSTRYITYGEIAAGGMASVQYGRLAGPPGFSRLHPQLAREPEFVSMFIDEARICARVSHANVVPILDVISQPGELALVMEYVHGVTIDVLIALARQRGAAVPLPVAVALVVGVLHGLSAAHEARGDDGEPLHIVHRDVSPQNLIVGSDGIVRVLDFGIARARGRLRHTPAGQVKGKLLYMAPEQLKADEVDARADVYSAAVVLWELCAGAPLFDAPSESAIVGRVLLEPTLALSSLREDCPPALDAALARGLARDRDARFQSARQLAHALEGAVRCASQSELASWLDGLAGALLRRRAANLAAMQEGRAGTLDGAAPEHAGTRRLPAAETRIAAAAPAPTPRRTERESHASPRPRWRAFALVALALAALAALALYAHGPREAPASAAAAAAPSPASQLSGGPGAAPSPAAPTVDAPAPSAAPPSAVAPAMSEAPTSRAPRRKPRAGGPARAPSPPLPATPKVEPGAAQSARLDCSEPFTIDARGVKHWRRECL
jgi:eukaryotic-like serine/threonine-protein kinase